jgi:hypothetical protein
MKTKKCPQALLKKQVEDNLACVASIWIGGSSVNARPQSIKNGEIPMVDDKTIEEGDQSRSQASNQWLKIKWIMEDSTQVLQPKTQG